MLLLGGADTLSSKDQVTDDHNPVANATNTANVQVVNTNLKILFDC